MSGRLRHRRLQRKYFYPSVGASYRLSNKEWSLWSPCRSKCHGSINGIKSILPLASPQVVQTRKHSGEVRIAELGTPDKFPLILALARVTAVSALEGQSGHSSHRGQAPRRLPSEHPRERGILRGEGFSQLHILTTAVPQNQCLLAFILQYCYFMYFCRELLLNQMSSLNALIPLLMH